MRQSLPCLASRAMQVLLGQARAERHSEDIISGLSDARAALAGMSTSLTKELKTATDEIEKQVKHTTCSQSFKYGRRREECKAWSRQ